LPRQRRMTMLPPVIASLFNLAGPELFILVPMLGFWIWMIADCATNEREPGARVGWLLAVILIPFWIGALAYLFCRKLTRPKPHSS